MRASALKDTGMHWLPVLVLLQCRACCVLAAPSPAANNRHLSNSSVTNSKAFPSTAAVAPRWLLSPSSGSVGGSKKPPNPLDREDWELVCYANYLVPWSVGSSVSTRKCFLLASQGPCNQSQWLVLERGSPEPQPSCRARPCPSDTLYLWTNPAQATEGEAAPSARCVHKDSRSLLCPPNTLLTNDVFGHGTCICRNLPPHALWPPEASCHQLYSRGPCRKGQHFVPDFSARIRKAVIEPVGKCVENPCVEEHLVQWRDGSCRAWNESSGVCDAQAANGDGHMDEMEGSEMWVVGVDPDTLLPNCTYSFTNDRHGVRSPTRRCDEGKLDASSICRPIFHGTFLPYGTFLQSLYNRSSLEPLPKVPSSSLSPTPLEPISTSTELSQEPRDNQQVI